MTTVDDINKTLHDHLEELQQIYGVAEIGVFGSYVRGEQRPDSDLDILIELTDPPRISLLGLVNLQNYLSDLLGIKIDLSIKENLRNRIGRRILQEVVSL